MVKPRSLNRAWSDLNMAALSIEKLMTHYAYAKKAEGRSPKTIEWYGEMLRDFLRFLVSSGREGVLDDLSPITAREFIINEQTRGLSPYSVQGKVRALKAFSSWLQAENYTPENRLCGVKLPKVPVKIIEPLSRDEINALVDSQNPLTALGSRDLAILVTLLAIGIRCSELTGLRFEDAHIDEGYLKVLGKGNKERVVPLGSLAQKVLFRYVLHFRPEPLSERHDYLFLTLYGTKLEPNAVRLILRRWGKKAGVNRLHPHLCRHTYATNFLSLDCGDIFRPKQILGHSSLEMVNRYVHYSSAQNILRTQQSPLDRLEIRKLMGCKIDRQLGKIRKP